jgi:hypothetical protein
VTPPACSSASQNPGIFDGQNILASQTPPEYSAKWKRMEKKINRRDGSMSWLKGRKKGLSE